MLSRHKNPGVGLLVLSRVKNPGVGLLVLSPRQEPRTRSSGAMPPQEPRSRSNGAIPRHLPPINRKTINQCWFNVRPALQAVTIEKQREINNS